MPNDSPVAEIYRSCMNTIHDTDYCISVIDAVLYTATRRAFTVVPDNKNKPRFHLILPPDVDYVAGVLVDATKKSVVVMLRAPHHTVSLVFERGQDNKLTLKSALLTTLEHLALMNGPLKKPEAEL